MGLSSRIARHPATSTLRNPIWHGEFADPYVFKVRGQYYAYGTEAQEHPAMTHWYSPS
jgi:hypothetical protein